MHVFLTNEAKELTSYKFEFKPDANRIRKDFVYTKVCSKDEQRMH
jgi:hypothetical protein